MIATRSRRPLAAALAGKAPSAANPTAPLMASRRVIDVSEKRSSMAGAQVYQTAPQTLVEPRLVQLAPGNSEGSNRPACGSYRARFDVSVEQPVRRVPPGAVCADPRLSPSR